MTKKEMINNFVYSKIQMILRMKESSNGRAYLASLRRGVGKTPGEIPDVWGLFLDGAPKGLYSDNPYVEDVQKEEWAVYIALTLFAVHQQGKSESVSVNGANLGNAAAMLMNDKTDDERNRVLRRFTPVVTASDMAELSYHLRSLVQLMKSKGIPLDYPKLACDIYDFQFEDSKAIVQLRWGREFYQYNEIKGD